MKTAVAIQHVAFEGLGVIAPALQKRGYVTTTLDACSAEFVDFDSVAPDLLIVLGGPIGVYEDQTYPLLRTELRLVEKRLQSGRPILGICLGAQLIAHAMGKRVYPGRQKEIGWAPIDLTPAGKNSPLAHLGSDTPVLHWHGDTFDLPDGAARLASTSITDNQAFSIGKTILGLQFHAECDGSEIEQWLVGHACELAQAKIDIVPLRDESAGFGANLVRTSAALFDDWLAALP